jgi:DNA-binding MarR family transcriptional regulator
VKNELTIPQLRVLAAVKGGGSLGDIAKRLKMKSRTGVYQIVQRLAASGHMKMEPRSLTAKGEKALASALDSLRETLAAAQGAPQQAA